MATNDDDVLKAERAYYAERASQLRQELRQHAKAYGETIGVALDADDITAEVVQSMLAEVVRVLRASGNVPLAERYQLAFVQFTDANRRFEALMDRMTGGEDDGANLTALRHESDSALEAFERVLAEVQAWFNKVENR